MIHLIFIDDYHSSRKNGIGRYREILLSEISKDNSFSVTLLSLNSSKTELEVSSHTFGIEIEIPVVNGGDWNNASWAICPLLTQYIADKPTNIFLFNISPCSLMIENIKRNFPSSKCIFVIHDQGWCSMLYGSRSLLHDIIYDRECSFLPNELQENVVDYYKEELKIYQNVDCVVSLSKSTYNILRSIYKIPQHKVKTIFNGYNFNIQKKSKAQILELRKKHNIPLNDQLVIFAGRPSKLKGIDALMKAYESIKDSYSHVKFVFCCSLNGIQEFEQYFRKFPSRIILTGHLSKEELEEWYYISDIGILPSYSEQCSYTIMEMINFGLPLVVSNGNGFNDLFRNHENAYVAKINNVFSVDSFAVEIETAINEALKDLKNHDTRIIQNAQSKFKRIFDINGMISKYRSLFFKIVSYDL